MSFNTWMPRAVASEAVPMRLRLWRAVEAQHVASTLRLVANIDEQLVLERLLEANKPAIPAAAADLHYLLATPFRYASPIGSRFRAGSETGVWYGAEHERTACAELGFWRWRFLRDSAALESLGPVPQTVFRAGVEGHMVDLTAPPFDQSRADWVRPDDYSATQAFARVVRAANLDAIRYESVRDPQQAAAVAVLTPGAFKPRRPLESHTWFLTVRQGAAIWQREGATFEFDAGPWRAA